MRTALWLWLPLVLLFGQDDKPRMSEVEVPAPGDRHVARIAKVAGHEALDDALSRWKLTMHDVIEGAELWSVSYPHSAAPARYFASADGSTFVRLGEAFTEGRSVVRIDRFGERTVERNGRDFDLDRNDVVRTNHGSTWLTEEDDKVGWGWVETEHGPALMLTLESGRGWRRELDVSMGVPLPPFDFGEPLAFPGFPDGTGPGGTLEIPYISSVRVPTVTLATLPLRIDVTGQHNTPNWKFFAFQMNREDEQRFVLTPWSQPPPRGSILAQVLDGFQATAVVQGLAPGRYEFAVVGRGGGKQYHPVEVLQGRTKVRLETSGGIAGIRDTTEVFQPGIVRQTRSRAKEPAHPRHLTPDEQSRFDKLFRGLPEDAVSQRSTIGSDFFEYRLGWWAGDRWREATVDDGTMKGPVKKLIEFLRRL